MKTSPHVHERELLDADAPAPVTSQDAVAGSSTSAAPLHRPAVTRSQPSFSQSFLLGPLPKLNSILKHQAACEPDEVSPEQRLRKISSPTSITGMDLDEEADKSESAGCRTRLCSRHQRMTDSHAADQIQSSIDALSLPDKTAVNAIWSQFAAAPSPLRQIILRGLLSICCPSQLSFLSEQVKAECRIDPLSLMPREISSKIMGFLDAASLCRAAQVSKLWHNLADDDTLWRKMCEQHIERKCEKCGWGLPLMERTRRTRLRSREASPSPAALAARSSSRLFDPARMPQPPTQPFPSMPLYQAVPSTSSSGILPPLPEDASVPGAPAPATRPDTVPAGFETASGRTTPTDRPFTPLVRSQTPTDPSQTSSGLSLCRPAKRDRLGRMLSPTGSPQQGPVDMPLEADWAAAKTRPWKSVYSERLIIERNWRKGNCAVQVFSGHTDAVTCLQVEENLPHPSFPILMTGSWDRSVKIWNLETGEAVGTLRGHERGIRALQFDANKLITGSMDSTLKIWNWRTGEELRTLSGHTDAVTCLVAEKNTIVSGSADSTVRVWDFDRGVVVCLRGHNEWVNSVALWSPPTTEDLSKPSKTAKPFLSKGFKKTIEADLPPEQQPIRLLFSAGDDGQIRVWDLRTNTCVRVLESHVAQVQSLSVGTIFTDHHVEQDHKEGEEWPAFPSEEVGSVPANNNVIGYFDQHRDVAQANPTGDNSQRFPCRPLTAPPRSNVGPSGQRPGMPLPPAPAGLALPSLDLGDAKPALFSSSLDNTLKEWDVEKSVCKRTMFGHVQGVWDLDMDKLRIVSASHDRTIKIWEREPSAASGPGSSKCLHTLVGHRGAVISVRITDDRIISGSDDGDVRVWSFNTA